MVWEFGVFKFGVIALTFSYWSLEVQHGSSWQITLWGSEKRIVALHKDGIRRHGTVAKTLQRFNRTGYTQNRPLLGRPKKLSARGQHHIQMLCWEIDAWVLPALLQRLKGWGVCLSVLRPCCTLHQIRLYGCRPRRKPLLKMMHKKARKQFVEDKQTKDMDCIPQL